jgi:V8-like Glu-specific endopeptidase
LLLCVLMALAEPALGISKGQSVGKNDRIRLITVSIYGDNEDCTGVKVAADFVLTARHCKIDKSTRVIFADGDAYKIIKYFVPDARGSSSDDEHDFALIKIEGEVPGPVAEIADTATVPANGSGAWVVGYGGKKITKRRNPLRRLPVTILNRDFSFSAISIRTHNGAVCDGDSGGPGYTQINDRIVLWGISSASLWGNFKCASTELYAKVSSEYEWIKRIISGDYLISSRNPLTQ